MPNSDPTPQPFWQPALKRAEIWRSLVGLFLIHVVFFAATFGIIVAGARLIGATPQGIVAANTPAKAMVFFATFLGYHLGLWLVTRYLHKRPYRSLFGALGRVNWRHFLFGLLAAWALSALTSGLEATGLLPLPKADNIETFQNMPFKVWIMFLAPALALIFIQIMAEELVFRGYLLQQLRARFSSVWLWAVLPSLIFGILHFDPGTFGVNAYFYVLHTTVVGIILALITLQTGNIGAAAGLHMANNAMLLLLGNAGSMDGLSLYLTTPQLDGPFVGTSIVMQTISMVVAFVIWRHMTRQKANAASIDVEELQNPPKDTN